MTQEKVPFILPIWRKFPVFDKGLGNFENLYIRNLIKINYRGGLPTLDFQIAWNGEKIGWNWFLDFTKVERSEIIGERSKIIGERSEIIGERSATIGERSETLGERSEPAHFRC